MINTVSLIGTLIQKDEKIKEIRYLKVDRYYQTSRKIFNDIIPLVNWNKEAKGELFSFKDNSLVALKGRLEVFEGKVVVVVESISYLGLTN